MAINFDAVTSAVDLSTLIIGLFYVAGALVSVHCVWVGAKMILIAIRGDQGIENSEWWGDMSDEDAQDPHQGRFDA